MRKLMCKILSTVLIVATCLTGCSKSDTYVAGTYTGTGEGFGGAVTATITVTGSEITDVVLDGPSETPSIGGAAFETLGITNNKANTIKSNVIHFTFFIVSSYNLLNYIFISKSSLFLCIIAYATKHITPIHIE